MAIRTCINCNAEEEIIKITGEGCNGSGVLMPRTEHTFDFEVYEKLKRNLYNSPPYKFEEVGTARYDVEQKKKAEFKRDLFRYHAVTKNPKADKCFMIAWDLGHSSGFSDVAGYFDQLVELIKP